MNEPDRDYRRALRQTKKSLRGLGESLGQVERNVSALCDRVAIFEDKMKKNVIKTLNIRYDSLVGFCSDTICIREGKAHLDVALPSAERQYKFLPPSYEVGPASVDLLDLRITQCGTIAAVRVSNHDPNFQLPLNWVKPRNRADSAIFLFDEIGQEYYFPIWTDLTGQLIPNAPRTGLVLFETFRTATSKLCLYLRGARLTTASVSPELIFRLDSDKLSDEIQEMLSRESLTKRAEDQFQNITAELHTKTNEVAAAVSSRRSPMPNRRSSGCLVVLLLAILAGYLATKLYASGRL